MKGLAPAGARLALSTASASINTAASTVSWFRAGIAIIGFVDLGSVFIVRIFGLLLFSEFEKILNQRRAVVLFDQVDDTLGQTMFAEQFQHHL